jgi:Bacterial Ig domain
MGTEQLTSLKLTHLMFSTCLVASLSACKMEVNNNSGDQESNSAPQATPQSIDVSLNTAASVTLSGTDGDGDQLTYEIIDAPEHGVLSGTAPVLTYTPTTGYYGPDSITFKVNDGKVDSAVASVTFNNVASLYYYNNGTTAVAPDTNWSTAENWWLDREHTQAANRVPDVDDFVEITSDTVEIFADNAPALSLKGYVGCGPDITQNGLQTANLSIANGGLLAISASGCGSDFGSGWSASVWSGNSSATAVVSFNNAINYGDVLGDAVFLGTSTHSGTVQGNAVFRGNSYLWDGVINGTANFYNSSYTDGTGLVSTIVGVANFYDTSFTTNTFFGDVVLHDSSAYSGGSAASLVMNDTSSMTWGEVRGNLTANTSAAVKSAIVGGVATFNNNSYLQGEDVISILTAIFKDSSSNRPSDNSYTNGYPVIGSAEFWGSSRNQAGAVIDGDATFTESSLNLGTVTGACTGAGC